MHYFYSLLFTCTFVSVLLCCSVGGSSDLHCHNSSSAHMTIKPWTLRCSWCSSAASVNVLVPNCKIYNDASCDISADGQLLAVFIPSSQRGFPDEGILAIYSLAPHNLGEMLYTKRFGTLRNQIVHSSLTSVMPADFVGLLYSHLEEWNQHWWVAVE